MTGYEAAQFVLAQDALNLGHFFIGLFLGLSIGSVFSSVARIITARFHRPRRVKTINLNHQFGSKEYLYLYNGAYYTKDQYVFLTRKAFNK